MKKNSKKEKLNPIMTEGKKVKKIGINSGSSDGENEIRNFIIIVIVLIVAIVGIYFGTELLSKDKDDTISSIKTGTINYEVASVGMILNRPYDEYYVMAFKSSDKKSTIYSAWVSKYTMTENALKVYFCDLDNAMNKDYYNVGDDNESNPNAKEISDLDFGEVTLIKVKDGKINKYLESEEEIKDELK